MKALQHFAIALNAMLLIAMVNAVLFVDGDRFKNPVFVALVLFLFVTPTVNSIALIGAVALNRRSGRQAAP